jgi:phenylacetate-CoA ligase
MKPFLSSPQWDAGLPELWQHWQLHHLRDYLKRRVIPFSTHYRDLFKQEGLQPEDIRTFEDWQRVPFSNKADLTVSADKQRDLLLIPCQAALRREPGIILHSLLHGKARTKDRVEAEFRPIFTTSTTGRSSASVPFFYTKHDLANLETTGRRIMEVGRSSRDYRHVNMFPYAPHLGFWQTHYAGLGFGTFMVSTGGGRSMGTDGNIALIDRIQPDILIGMPTFIYHVLRQAVEEGRHWHNLKRIVLGGEKMPQGLRTRLRELCVQLGSLGTYVISTYAFTEAKTAWPECPTLPHEGPSGFHLYPDLGIIEVVDPKTGAPVPAGSPGEIVYTPLDARGTVVLRYRTGDIAEGGLTWEPCMHCGRRCPRLLGPISRSSEVRSFKIDKVKGTLVDFNMLEHLLDDVRGLSAWQIELRKHHDDPLECDELTLHVSLENRANELALRDQILRRFHEITELSPNCIVIHSLSEMREKLGVGRLLKEEKLLDLRGKAAAMAPVLGAGQKLSSANRV